MKTIKITLSNKLSQKLVSYVKLLERSPSWIVKHALEKDL